MAKKSSKKSSPLLSSYSQPRLKQAVAISFVVGIILGGLLESSIIFGATIGFAVGFFIGMAGKH